MMMIKECGGIQEEKDNKKGEMMMIKGYRRRRPIKRGRQMRGEMIMMIKGYRRRRPITRGRQMRGRYKKCIIRQYWKPTHMFEIYLRRMGNNIFLVYRKASIGGLLNGGGRMLDGGGCRMGGGEEGMKYMNIYMFIV